MANGRHDPGAPPADVQVGTVGVGWVLHQFCNNKGDRVDRVAIPKSYSAAAVATLEMRVFFRPSFLLSFPPAVATIQTNKKKKTLLPWVPSRHPREPLIRPCPRNEGQRQLASIARRTMASEYHLQLSRLVAGNIREHHPQTMPV